MRFEYNEFETIERYFEFPQDSVYRKIVKNSLNTKNYSFIYLIEFISFYLVHTKKIKDYKTITTIVFRYLVLVLFHTFATKRSASFYSKELEKILKKPLTIERLMEKVEADENDLWATIYNNVAYNNEFQDITDKENIEKISNILYKKQSFFAGDTPLLNSIDEKKDNIILIDEIVCRAINRDVEEYNSKHNFTIEFMNDDDWREYISDKEHEKAYLKIISFILKEAINQRKTYPGDAIHVESVYYYRAIAGSTNGFYNQIKFVKYDKDSSNMEIDYSIIIKPLIFKLNDVSYALTKNGLFIKS